MDNHDVKVGQVRVLRPQPDGNYTTHWNKPIKIEKIKKDHNDKDLVIGRNLSKDKSFLLYATRFMVK